MFLLDAKQCNTSIPYGGRGVSSHPEEVSFESGSMVRSPHISKKKNSKDIAEKSQEGKFKRNDSSNEVRSLQFDPLEGSSSHNLPSERLSNKGVSKKSKKSDLLQICVDEIYKPVFCNETKPNQTKLNETKTKQTQLSWCLNNYLDRPPQKPSNNYWRIVCMNSTKVKSI